MPPSEPPVYERHIFVCTAGEWCPTVDGDGLGVHAALKAAAEAAGLAGRVRVNRAGCFSQCGSGPMVVIYPEGVWYAAVSPGDAAEIVERHLVGGEPVERLRYRPRSPGSNQLDRDAAGRPIGRPSPWPTPGRSPAD
jgi:(2Fe-2S) ferredoxin